MGFKALVVDKSDDGTVSQNISMVEIDDLPDGDVTVGVEYSTLNYKD